MVIWTSAWLSWRAGRRGSCADAAFVLSSVRRALTRHSLVHLLVCAHTVQIYTRLNQPHNVYKGLLSRVVLLLAAADPVAAQRAFEHSLDVTGYAASDEAGAAEDMIGCYSEMIGSSGGHDWVLQ